jgi:uncharacterized protein (DUF1330 family)
MSKAYVLFQFNMSDPEKFGLYIQNAAPTVLANGGSVLVAAADADVREGTPPAHRVTIIEFPSRAAAEAWYASSEYAAFKHLRHEATSAACLVFLDGFEPPPGPREG